jgi:hypothetical protein
MTQEGFEPDEALGPVDGIWHEDDPHDEQKWRAFDLIHLLIQDVKRLELLVVETREEANRLSRGTGRLPYDMTWENVSDRSYVEHPAVAEYMEMYGEGAVLLDD